MNKRIVLFASLLAASLAAAWAAPPSGVRLTWTGDPSTTQTIAWTTGPETAAGAVEFRTGEGQPARTVCAPPPVLQDGVALWTVTLTGLAPDTVYTYRVGGEAGWSQPHTFRTAPRNPEGFHFLVFGDTANEDLDYGGWGENVQSAFSAQPGARFFMNVGDTVDRGQRYADWAAWLAAAGSVPARIPAMLTVAKDECNFGAVGGQGEEAHETGPPRLFQKVWNYPPNGPAGYAGQAYSFDYGHAHIVSIPNQFVAYYPGDEKAQDAMMDEIARWLEQDLAATTKPWKIVMMHLNFYPTMADRSTVRQRKVLQPILDRHHVDVVFDGHCHTIARTFPIRDNALKPCPAEGTVYYTVGLGQPDPKKDVSRKIWHAFAFDGQTRSNYLRVDVKKNALTIRNFLSDGTLVDRYRIDRDDPADSTLTAPPVPYGKTHLVLFGTVVPVWYPPLSDDQPGYGGLPFRDGNAGQGVPDLIPNGEWCFDIRTIAAFMNGVWDREKRTLSYDDLELEVVFPEDTVYRGTTEKGFPMDYVSEKGLEAAGFDVYYDRVLNLWFVERFRL